jgi:hypothetical protein
MLRLYHVLLGIILLAVLTPFGVKIAFSRLSSTKNLQPTQVAQSNPASSTAPTHTEENIWKSILGKTVPAPDWDVAACKGTASLLCVSSKTQHVGTVEIGVYPLENQPNFQRMLAQAGIPSGSQLKNQSSSYQNQISTALKAWVMEHYTLISEDRQGEYGNRIIFSPQPPQPVPVGKLKGMRYGFVGINPQGEIHEQHLGYVAFNGSALYVMTTAFDPTSETGKFEKLEDFRRFEPYLSSIVNNLKLPK